MDYSYISSFFQAPHSFPAFSIARRIVTPMSAGESAMWTLADFRASICTCKNRQTTVSVPTHWGRVYNRWTCHREENMSTKQKHSLCDISTSGVFTQHLWATPLYIQECVYLAFCRDWGGVPKKYLVICASLPT